MRIGTNISHKEAFQHWPSSAHEPTLPPTRQSLLSQALPLDLRSTSEIVRKLVERKTVAVSGPSDRTPWTPDSFLHPPKPSSALPHRSSLSSTPRRRNHCGRCDYLHSSWEGTPPPHCTYLMSKMTSRLASSPQPSQVYETCSRGNTTASQPTHGVSSVWAVLSESRPVSDQRTPLSDRSVHRHTGS